MCQTSALIAGVCFIFAAGYAKAEDESGNFLAAIEEVPLMAELTEDLAATLYFDKPSGRLIEAYAYGKVSVENATNFYLTVMPEFGWQIEEGLVFLREGEMLLMEFIPEERSLVVRFILSPS
ncbi:MAG: hypothetical protein CMM54_03130 [Rhodospirillaceae bacterium]|nr:hypothetical protein [Rhodospirillaceae bacterium]